MSIKNFVLTNSFEILYFINCMKLIGTKEASVKLNISQTRVQALIKANRLPAEFVGRDWVIKEEDLKLVEKRKNGRPKKTMEVKP